ncbi:methyltransferase domain-containing protein [Glycomyces salinus]|uniref:methyltransferase domain-containing protein n=1 Tax=Glycomyces salinus TaxID=980294 RepID=UPI0018EBE1C5|nr:methyltransferase domain-containing protein [Glycomyces salinus]
MSRNRQKAVGYALPELHLFASTVHGLEPIAAAELTARGHRVLGIRKRQVLVSSPPELADDRPRTIDDLLIQLASAPDPGPVKADLAALRLDVELEPIRAALDGGEATLSVSASMIGRRTYNRYDLEEAIGTHLARRLGARLASRRGGARPPEGAVELRATLSPEGLLLGLRGRRAPLHRREWRKATIPGSLHPPVAAAMARLAEVEPGMTVLDPCCGAGTILIEAAEAEPSVRYLGSDRDPEALDAAARNADGRRQIEWQRADAAELPLPTGSVDRMVTNPAWGRQVRADTPFQALLDEWKRVLTPGGRLVCLLPPELPSWVEDAGWTVEKTVQVSVSGRHPLIAVAEKRS